LGKLAIEDFKYFVPVQVVVNMPDDFVLYQNYPNPFNANTKFSFYTQISENKN